MSRVKIGISLLAVTLAVAGLGAAPARSSTPHGGTELWIARYDAGSSDFATSLAASPDGSKVFVAGYSSSTTFDWATIAYDAATGAALWTARYDGPGNGSDVANSVAASPDGSKVFVTGESEGSAGDDDYTTVAYDAVTGVALWIARYDGPGNGDDFANSVAASPDGSKVFVTGESDGSTGIDDFATIAYDAATGVALWDKRYDGPGHGDDVANSVAASPFFTWVFVTGQSEGSAGDDDFATIAYDAATGDFLWGKRYDGPGNGSDIANSVAISPDGSKVFVTGGSYGLMLSDYATIAYDATTGGVVWLRRYNGPRGLFDSAQSVAASPDGSKVFVTGSSDGRTVNSDYATSAYDAATGDALWGRRYKGVGGYDQAVSVAISPDGSKVFVTGESEECEFCELDDYATAAYDTATGDRLWGARYDEGDDGALSVVVSPDGSKVFVTGISDFFGGGGGDYTTIAYDA